MSRTSDAKGFRARLSGLLSRTGGSGRTLTEADVVFDAPPALPDAAASAVAPRSVDAPEEPPPGVAGSAPPTLDAPSAPARRTDAARVRTDRTGWYGSLHRRVRVGLWLVFVAWLALGGLLFGRWSGILRQRPPGPPASAPVADLHLIAAHGPDGPPAMALFYAGEESSGMVLLPAGTQVEVPGIGAPQALDRTLELFGQDVLGIAVANMLGTVVPTVGVVGPEEFAALVDDLGTVEVSVPETVEVIDAGVLRTLFVRGVRPMGGAEFVRFLTVDVSGQNELERVARQNAAWRGLVAALARKDAVAVAADHWASWSEEVRAEDVGRMLAALVADDGFPVVTLPVERTGVTATDLYAPLEERIGPVRDLLSDARTQAFEPGRRIRLLVGADGNVGPPVARMLVENGYKLVVTGAASQPYEDTRVVIAANTPELRAVGRTIVELMGTGRLGLLSAEQGVFDVTLVIGRDWARAHGFPQTGEGG